LILQEIESLLIVVVAFVVLVAEILSRGFFLLFPFLSAVCFVFGLIVEDIVESAQQAESKNTFG